ncbi:putative Peptide chain release factor 1 [Pseudomonas phage 16Q]|nr:putative Peptide chain release factor 1 [Pseudomonas phage 16Q]
MLDPQDLRVTSYLPQAGHGAGGMSVGMGTSGIIVHHIPSGLGISCDSERSQYANKNKALALLESLLLAVESEKHMLPPPTPYVAGKVMMIKDVCRASGCGLKEAKEAVDRMGTFEGAMSYLTGSTGYCSEGNACVCGGDLLAIREGCYNWKK